uniref:F-box domain-containing protein n=1 Tax=Setaria italica TaxID=4555 RepID=K3XS79_SETIT
MVARWHPSLLVELPAEVAIEIASHLTATLEWPMEDLRNLRANCSAMRHVCGDRTGRRVALERFAIEMQWNDGDGYDSLLTHLTQASNPVACFLTEMEVIFEENRSPRPCLDELARTAAGRNNVAAYVAALFLYRANSGVGDDDTAMWYIRQVEGEEESGAAADQQRRHRC